jgi:nitrite reductase (NO-forming)/hydroxylamine reductase
MPNPELSPEGIESVIAFMAERSAAGPLEPVPPIELSEEAFEETADLYFNRCAGCHGTYRGGATGPDIGPERSIALGTDTLAATIRHGTPSGMPGLGEMGVVSDEEVAALAAFLQLEPPEAPQLSLEEIRETWTLLVAPEDRPTEPAHTRDWEDFFGIILRDSGQTAIIDGDTREELVRIDSGFAGHILRSSLTGRYFYAIGRDGWVTMIDLWTDPPTAVAQARGCYDARSVEGSKLESVGEAYVIEGCYWPNQYVVFDGQTLEPLFRGDIEADAVDTGEALSEVRIAVIVASHYNPYWLLALKESGHVAVVDYSAPDFPIIAMLEADRFLHDGGWDHTGRYLIVAANARNRMVVVDAEALEVVAMIDTGAGPHPGRGANWEDPEFGWVNATTHMGEGRLLVYGADPAERPDVAWQVVRDVPLPTAGSLFLKTHPASPWLLIDFPVSQDVAQQRRMCAYSKAEGEIDRCWEVSDDDPIVHFEFNAEGTEIWVSVWGPYGEIAIYDAVSLEELGRITGLPTPTGKFNVFNTAHDIY